MRKEAFSYTACIKYRYDLIGFKVTKKKKRKRKRKRKKKGKDYNNEKTQVFLCFSLPGTNVEEE